MEPKSRTEVCDEIMQKYVNEPIETQLYELVKKLGTEKKTSNYINDCVERLVSTKNVSKKYSELGLNKIGKFDSKTDIQTFIKKFESKMAKSQQKTKQNNATYRPPIMKRLKKVKISTVPLEKNSSEIFDPVPSETNTGSISGVNPGIYPGTDIRKSHSPVNDFEEKRSRYFKRNPPRTRSLVGSNNVKGGKTRKNSWIQFVKKVYNEEKKKNKNFTYKEAMQKAASMK